MSKQKSTESVPSDVTPKKSPAKTEKSNRHLVFAAIAKSTDGLTNPDIRKKIKMSENNGQLGVILRGEIAAKRIRVAEHEDGTYYQITALGKKHLEADTIDTYAREKELVAKGRGGK